MKPEVFLFDEPTTGLDEETTERIIGFLHRSTELSCIIIFHDHRVLERPAHCLYMMKDGKIQDLVSSRGVVMEKRKTTQTVR